MKRRRQRLLDEEERILWHEIARTVVPLKGRVLGTGSEPSKAEPARQDRQDPAAPPPKAPTARPPSRQRPGPVRTVSRTPALDRPTRTKIARGRLEIDASIDLHGLTQAEAHDLLLAFLRRASASEKRHVLVVTGKGSTAGGEGILRRAVPGWLATPSFNGLVSGYGEAARHHGGGGALYVRLRKPRSP